MLYQWDMLSVKQFRLQYTHKYSIFNIEYNQDGVDVNVFFLNPLRILGSITPMESCENIIRVFDTIPERDC